MLGGSLGLGYNRNTEASRDDLCALKQRGSIYVQHAVCAWDVWDDDEGGIRSHTCLFSLRIKEPGRASSYRLACWCG